jgi:chromosome segregation protein
VRLLKGDDAGQAALLVGGAREVPPVPSTAPAPGARWARDLVTLAASATAVVGPALHALLDGVAVVPDLDAAAELVAARPELTAVTLEGDVVGSALVRGGSASAPSLLEVQAAVDEAGERAADAAREAEQARRALEVATRAHDAAQEEVTRTLERLHDSDARLAAVAEQLAQLGSTARAAQAESARVASGIEAAERSVAADAEALAELEERLEVAESTAEDDDEPSTELRDRLAQRSTPPAARRWRPGSRCAPPRSGPGRSPAARSSWSGRRPPSGTPAPAPPPASSAASARSPPPRPSSPGRGTPWCCSRPRWPRPSAPGPSPTPNARPGTSHWPQRGPPSRSWRGSRPG